MPHGLSETPSSSDDNKGGHVESQPSSETPTPTPAPQDTQNHSTDWAGGTIEERKAMFKLAQNICAEEGLTALSSRLLKGYNMRADVLATIHGESGFNQWCENKHTFDYGLCQFNANTYLIEYGMTPEYAKEHPEECIRIMARNFKAGRESNWVAYQKLQGAITADEMDSLLAIYA